MSRRSQILGLALVGGAFLAVWAWLARSPQGAQPSAQSRDAPNILLVTIDTLRADRVGAYGHAEAATATLDRLAREGVLVADAVVHVPQTRPSHASLFTGRLPYEHGLRDNFSPALDPVHTTLATLLKQRGYATGGFIGAYPVSRDSGLHQGFDVFDDPFSGAPGGGLRLESSARSAGAVVDSALEWIDGLQARPFFAWVHVFDAHAPYEPPEAYANIGSDAYDGEIAYVDAQIGRLMEWLDENGEAKRTLMIAISDHGEGLGDHGEDEHQLFVYDSTLHVPLLLRWPGQLPAGSRIEGQFRGVDLLPTVLDLVGSTPPETSGVSHASVLRAGGVIPDNELYAESLYGQIHFGWAPLRVLRAKGWKYTEAPRAELYELREDPGETRNRVGDSERTAEGLRELLFRYDMSDPTAASVSVDPAATEKLAALGYIGGAFFTDEPSGVDPKDMMSEYRAFRRGTVRALELIEAGDHAGAVRLLQPLAEPRIGPDGRLTEFVSFTVSFYLGRALLELGRFEEAIEPLQAALRLSPSTASLYVSLARAQAGAGRFQDAAATATLGLQAAPGHAALMHLRGRLYLNDGATGPAETALREAREAAPDHVLVHVDLAHLLRTTGREQEALAEAEEALRLDPRAVPAQLARGLCLAALGRSDEAEAAFREALELSPADPDALFFVATIALRSGRFAEAVDRLESLVRVAPGHPQARQMLAQARARSGGTRKAETTVHLRILRVADRQAAERIQERVRSGEEFAALARAESQDASASVGGDLGGVRISDLAEPLRTAAAHLAPGDVSPLLSTSNGFVLLQRQR